MLQSLDIALVSYEFPPFGGGEGTYTYELAKLLTASGHRVTLVIPAREHVLGKEIAENIFQIKHTEIPGFRLVSFAMGATRVLKGLSRKGEIDLVHYTNDYGFVSSSRQIGVPVLSTIHHPHWVEAQAVSRDLDAGPLRLLRYKLTQYFLDKLEHRTLVKADRIIAVSNFSAKTASARHRIPFQKFRVVPNSVDINRFNPHVNGSNLRKVLGIGDSRMILYVGSTRIHKGLPFLMEAFGSVASIIPDVRMIVVGKVSEAEKQRLLLGLSGHAAGRVIFPGWLNDAMMPEAYAAADIVVLPSLMEGFGRALIEAMATGKACVASKVGPLPEVVMDGVTGSLVPPADSVALSSALTKLLLDGRQLMKFGMAGRERAERDFATDMISGRLTAAYQELLDAQ